MDYQAFVRKLRRRGPARVYLIEGEEDYIKDECVKRLKEAILEPATGDLNYSVFEGGKCAGVDLRRAVMTLPSFSSMRLAVVEEADSLPQDAQEEVAEWLGEVPETTVLAFVCREKLDRRRRLARTLVKEASLVECRRLAGGALEKWIAKSAERMGVSIREDAARELVYLVGDDLRALRTELEKIATYVGEESVPVTVELVRELVSPSAERSGFELVDLICERNTRKALPMLVHLLQNGEPPPRIIGALVWRFRNLVSAQDALEEGRSRARSILAGQSMPRLEVDRVLDYARNFTREELVESLARLSEADFRVKSGQRPVDVELELVVLELGRRVEENM